MISENLSKQGLKKNPKILILGGGYIGGELYRHFTFNYGDVKIVNRVDLDYHDVSKLNKYLFNHDFNYVINCSGFTGRPNVDEGEKRKEECWELNVNSPLRINHLCNKLGVRYIHISSGCIYTGYEKEFIEDDKPNFGLFDESSFYSKSKHAFELGSRHLDNKIVRIRMPICNDIRNPRNYLGKIMKYPNLIDYINSKTYIPDLCGFVEALIEKCDNWKGQDIYNVVNGDPLSTKSVISQLNSMNEGNWDKLYPNWVDVSSLKLAAPRSNCVLDNSKALEIYDLKSEEVILNMVCNGINGIQAV